MKSLFIPAVTLLFLSPSPSNWPDFITDDGLKPINQFNPISTTSEKLEMFSNLDVDVFQVEDYISKLPLQNPEQRFTLEWYQTPNRNQKGRDGLDTGACPTFAMIAGLEAFYKRECLDANQGINPLFCDVDLSEEYYIHLNSQISTLNDQIDNENFSSFCGVTRNLRNDWQSPGMLSYQGKAIPVEIGNDGALVSVSKKIQFAKQSSLYFACAETSASLSQEDVDAYEYDYDHFSADLRKRAIHAIEGYMTVGFDNPSDIEQLIFNRHEIVASNRWDHLVQAGTDANGVDIIEYDPSGGCDPVELEKLDPPKNCGGHATLVIGYDKVNQRYLLKNSYGEGSNYWIPYFKDDGITPVLSDGVIITDVRPVGSGPQKEARWIGEWKVDLNGTDGRLVIRRTRRSANEHNSYQGGNSTPLVDISTPPRIGTYYTTNNARHPVYGETSNNGKRLVMYVDFNTDNNSYSDYIGDVSGHAQRFDLYQFEDADFAAGVTFQNTQRFGTFIARPYMDIEHTFSLISPQPQDWVKIWSLNIGDKWEGLLHIASVANNQVEGRFLHNGSSYVIDGYSVGNNYLGITIHFDNGTNEFLNLYYHRWEKDFISGNTQTGEGLYAVPGTLVIPLNASSVGMR